jgi:putative addiction module CopG family antidote
MSDIILAPDLAEIVRRKVASGDYPDPDAVLRDALDLLNSESTSDALARLRKEVALGLAQADRGELVDGREALERIRNRHGFPPFEAP